MTEWKNILNLNELKYESWSEGTAYKGDSAEIASKMGAKKLGFHAEKLKPKHFSCPLHFHHTEEELFIVLEGKAILRQKDKYREVKKGDVIHFLTGENYSHQFYNHTDEDFHFIAISNNESLEVCEYPDSKKVLTSIHTDNNDGKYFTFEKNSKAEYWKGEENPREFWSKEFF